MGLSDTDAGATRGAIAFAAGFVLALVLGCAVVVYRKGLAAAMTVRLGAVGGALFGQPLTSRPP